MENPEVLFREELHKKYQSCQKYLIPRDKYYSYIDELKRAATKGETKSRHEYYLMHK